MPTVEIDGQYHLFDVPPCAVIEIPINKRSTRVDVEGIFNANSILLTDGQFTNCSEVASFECPEDATFCRSKNLHLFQVSKFDKEQVIDPTGTIEIELQQEACCVENAYLYVLPDDAAKAIAYKVRVEDIGRK